MSILPLEITETIVDSLVQDDPSFSSTKACAFVCHDFLHICRKHIFAFISLSDNYTRSTTELWNTNATTPMLQRLLSTTPEIANHIRELRYETPKNGFMDLLLAQTFNKIKHLKKLTIWHYWESQPLHWADNPLRSSLLHLMQLPTLIHLVLFDIKDFVLADLMPCTNLQHFEFNRLTVLDTNDILVSNLPDSSIRLAKISAGLQSPSAISKMCAVQRIDRKPFIDFNYLNSLSVYIEEADDIQASRNLFSRCKQLTSINVEAESIWGQGMMNFTQISLSKMLHPSVQTLQHLCMRATFDTQTGCDDFLTGFSFELGMISKNNVIETIDIEIYFPPFADCKRVEEWGRLDAVLTQLGWPKLQGVSLTIEISSYYGTNDELTCILEKLPQTQLPKLSSRKTFPFEFSIKMDDN